MLLIIKHSLAESSSCISSQIFRNRLF